VGDLPPPTQPATPDCGAFSPPKRRRGTLADYQKIAAASGVCDRL